MSLLKKIITSRVLYKTINHFCNSNKPIGARELSRLINEDPGNTYRTLLRLTDAGIIKKESKDRYSAIKGGQLRYLRALDKKD